MGDEFYAILKLVSGEEIFSLILVDNDQEDDTIIVLQNPVIMWTVATPNGTFIKVKPWMELPNEDIFMIRLDKVIDEIIDDNIYNQLLSSVQFEEKQKETKKARSKKTKGNKKKSNLKKTKKK